MNSFSRITLLVLTSLLALSIFAGCAGPPTHSYVVDYQVVGDKTVKYIYVPGESSNAGKLFLDQSVALEICSLDDGSITDQEAIAEAEAAAAQAEATPAGEATQAQSTPHESMESDCRQSRILRTQEYR